MFYPKANLFEQTKQTLLADPAPGRSAGATEEFAHRFEEALVSAILVKGNKLGIVVCQDLLEKCVQHPNDLTANCVFLRSDKVALQALMALDGGDLFAHESDEHV